jgi:hypothetical protein
VRVEEARKSIELYLSHGVSPGDFLEAVLRNDLFEAFGRADESSRANLFEIVQFVYNNVPTAATRGNVDQWLSDKAYRDNIMECVLAARRRIS